MPGCRGAGPSFGTAGACPGGFWRAGWGAGQGDQVIEIGADAAGGEPAGIAAAFPGDAVVFGEGAGQAQLGEGRGDQPGPAGDLTRFAEGGFVPAQGVLGEPVGVLCRAACRVASSPAPTRTWSCGAVQESGEKPSWASHWNAHPATAAPSLPWLPGQA